MSLFLEKNMLASRFLSCLIAISVFVLIVSSLSLLQFADNSFIPRSVFRLVLVNSTSLYSTSSVTSGESKTPFLPLETFIEEKVQRQEIACQTSSSSNSSGGVGVIKVACDKKQALLRVYMYDLLPEFHFGLFGWKGNGNEMWPNVGQVPSYPGGLNLQHSIEYWLTLDLLSSNTPNITRPCTAIRVHNSSEADVFFVPFFSSLSYNRHSKPHGKEKVSLNRILQDRVVEFLRSRDEWNLNGGANHLIVAHHPNSMLVARKKLGSAMFVLADFGRYRAETANIEKDVIAPYKHMVRTLDADNSPSFVQRDILVYFQGAIYRKDGGTIRQELYYLLKDEKDVHFTFGSIKSNGVREAGRGMASSKFCLNIAGDTPSSNRLFDAIASHCIPVIISDDIELPFEDVLDYSKFCIFVRSSDAVRKGYLLNLLRRIKEDQWIKMWQRLKELTKHFEYQYPSQPNDAVDMIWQAIARKLSFIQLKAHRNKRYRSLQLFIKDR
ncbi:probable arabinosyltransferase ARAD1 [Lycium barbarum]|uniref:probable arabinosyltransferase ARAD1 n=1 Tax=Lycium barbarum TaxID=112863 RepID=UPI00293EC5DD|nr:probable arabinosyltransferase ARAD1 [Lycium barbarum]XP_060172481.1 probable arabinosyltransferase ARAD1 [Lycium barbarum]XP_060172482.1 probable arabinosyltransferase ARAD1 [Lycium barbarum]XP_060172483.1 probable arabinosyltransferase ARAD1 [Lycium barbarum]XP_060172484.1 probable arabinosyltransferase ARAD1 [Lycium barbarum]